MEGPEDAPRRPRLTNRTLFVLGAMNLIDCINFNLMLPYVDRMVSGFLDASPDDPRVARMVGFLIGVYSLCEVLFSVFWGHLSDRMGRKPALLLGLAGSAVAPVFFGLSQNLPQAFAARILDGFFCGNIGVTKAYLGEIVDSTNEARGFSFLAVCFSLGLLIGPMLGGELVDAAVWAPGLFAGTIFEECPYLLPNLTYACFAAFSWVIGALFLEETLPRSQRQRSRAASAESGDASLVAVASRSWRALRGLPRSLVRIVACYCLLTGYAAAWTQNFIEVVSLPRAINGFALGPQEIGLLQNCAAIGLLLTQLLFYPHLTKRFGYLPVFFVGCAANLTVTLLFPAYGLLADSQRFPVWRYVPLACMQCFGQMGFGFMFPTAFVWINRETHASGLSLGPVNGWCNSLGALCRGLVPPVMGSLLSVGLGSALPGGRYLAIFVNGVLLALSLKLALRAHCRLPAVHSEALARGCGQEAPLPALPARQTPLIDSEVEVNDRKFSTTPPTCPPGAAGA
mmetsp:Transcript_65233/g.144131  ORF Transcript_65233/g.144131 Transcript_65233/m.144131 type:complete len:512 (-) Transcript_65233:61-1596(-)